MRARSARGASLLELVVAMAVLTVFLLVLTAVAGEFRSAERAIRFGWSVHPDDMAVIARMRRDVADSHGYPASHQGRAQAPEFLILTAEGGETITWELEPERVRRTVWEDGVAISRWVANATPQFEIDAWELPDGTTAVRLVGRSQEGVVVDRIFTPRPE
ncbi:MAG: type IV pilus modification PilV family protein [Thermoanaerobaculia bacterium]